MTRKTAADNLALALVLLCIGVIGGRAASSSFQPGRGHSGRQARAVLLFQEGFEQASTLEVEEGYAPVAYGTPNLGGSGAYWGRTVARAAYGLFSSWCAGDGWNSPSFPPYGANCTPYYGGPCLVPPNTNTTMTTNPLDFSTFASGILTWDVWLQTEAADWFSVEASTDGVNFYGYSFYGSTSSGFVPQQLRLEGWPVLGNLMGRDQVWFRFGYSSNQTVLGQGAFVDNIRVEVDHADLLFGDGFASGDTSRWSFVVS